VQNYKVVVRMKRKVLAIIPAREGSKRIPNKNIVDLNGFPLISYTILAALSSGVFDKVVVSTDSSKIANISRKFGAEIPVLRPESLARDESSSYDVVAHMVEHLSMAEDFLPDILVLLQPTSPLRGVDQIIESVVRFNREFNSIDSMVGVTEVTQHPEWMYTFENNTNNLTKAYSSEGKYLRTQDLSGKYYINGAIYITKHDIFISTESLFGGRVSGYIMDEKSSIDIDTEHDFMIANILMSDKN